MQTDPLQQLKPLHLPPDPSWWPPAIGWWVLLIVLVILTGWILYRLTKFFRAMRPVRHGKHLLSDLYTSLKLGHISDEDFVHLSNQLIKRVLVPGLGKIKYSKLQNIIHGLIIDLNIEKLINICLFQKQIFRLINLLHFEI